MRDLPMIEAARAEGLVALLREAGRAHHAAFAHVGGEDRDWARWYAEYVAPRLAAAGDATVDPDAVTDALERAEQDRQHSRPDADWPTFYAGFLQARWPWTVRAP